MNKDTITLAKYLFTKGIESSLKIQKLLFFFRVEEYKNNDLKNSFFKANSNFQAWIYGPVNVESFKFMQQFFNGDSEKETFLLSKDEIKEIDEKYNTYFEKYCNYAPSTLVDMSHKNLSWINARGDIDDDAVCNNYLKEDQTFIEFKK